MEPSMEVKSELVKKNKKSTKQNTKAKRLASKNQLW
jgi:hypothetical protein